MAQAVEGDGNVSGHASAGGTHESGSGGQAVVAAASRSSSGTSSAVIPGQMADIRAFQLNVYAAAGGAGASLRVWVQQTLDGANWDDVAAFPVVAGDSGGSWIASMTVRQRDQAAEMHALQDGQLAAGQVANALLGRTFRAKWTIAGGGTFGFQVLAFARRCD